MNRQWAKVIEFLKYPQLNPAALARQIELHPVGVRFLHTRKPHTVDIFADIFGCFSTGINVVQVSTKQYFEHHSNEV
jgi:hypothetical protein